VQDLSKMLTQSVSIHKTVKTEKMKTYIFLHSWFAVLVSSVKYFDETSLTLGEFDAYPLVSRTERAREECEGVMEVEEVREVKGEEIMIRKIVRLSNLHTVLEHLESKERIEIWHR
jgi:hypothetical protein